MGMTFWDDAKTARRFRCEPQEAIGFGVIRIYQTIGAPAILYIVVMDDFAFDPALDDQSGAAIGCSAISSEWTIIFPGVPSNLFKR